MSISLFIALIALLVFFVGSAGVRAVERKPGSSLINWMQTSWYFQENVDLSTTASRIELSKLRKIQRLDGVQNVGALGFGSGSIVFSNATLDPLDVSIIGVEVGKPGSPPVIEGSTLRSRQRMEAVIEKETAAQIGLSVGDSFTIKTIQGTEEELYDLRIVGITDSREYLYAPSVFVPLQIWDEIRPQANPDPSGSYRLPMWLPFRVYRASIMKFFQV